MPNARGNAMTATTWQDNHSGRRRHKLMTKEIGDKIPAIGANESVEDHDDVLAPAKLFSPCAPRDAASGRGCRWSAPHRRRRPSSRIRFRRLAGDPIERDSEEVPGPTDPP